MRRLSVLFLVPVLAFTLETVNLIKDAGFEKNSEVWLEYSYADGDMDSVVVNRHDFDSSYSGGYCGSIDTRMELSQTFPDIYNMRGYLCQSLVVKKKLKDLDSLDLYHMVIYPDLGKPYTWGYGVRLRLLDQETGDLFHAAYYQRAPDRDLILAEETWLSFPDTIWDEGLWHPLERNLDEDWIQVKGLSPELVLDSFVLFGYGTNFSSNSSLWRSQKAFFDDIRLMGYADYDVGVKEIISEFSLTVDTPYVPMARIKNFGREHADSFLVIAVIEDSTFIAYIDTLPWSLPADTEDTVSFAEFVPDHQAEYVLHVYTVMTPDESDADDRLSLNLFCSVCQDSPEFPGISLELLNPITPNYLRVSYALPVGQLGIISVYDAAGRIQDYMNVRGVSEITITADLTPGVYFIRLDAGEESVTHKAVLLL